MNNIYFTFKNRRVLLLLLHSSFSYNQIKIIKNAFLILFILLLTTTKVYSQCNTTYPTSGATQIGSDFTFCIDNASNTLATAQVNAGKYVVVNVVKGFNYIFSVGNVFTGATNNETLTLFNGSTYVGSPVGNVGFASALAGATLTWKATFSGKVKVLLSKGACLNDNSTGGALTLTLNNIGNTQDDQNAFGTNQWVGHVYNLSGGSAIPPGGTSPAAPTASDPFIDANYVGFYNIASETISENFGGDTACFPVTSAVTNIYTQTFAVRYKMLSTKTGYYFLNVSGDDGVRVYVDGALVFNEWKEQSETSYCNNLIYLNGNSTIVLDYYENGGQNVVKFSLTPFSSAAANAITGVSSYNVCSGTSPGTLAANSYASTCAASSIPNITYQWQVSSDNAIWNNVASGGNAQNYAVPPIATSTNGTLYYRRLVKSAGTNDLNGGVVSNVITVNTYAATVGGTVTAAQTICSGTSPADLTLSGQTGAVVRWQKAPNVGFTTGVVDIASTSTTLSSATVGNLTANTYFRAVVQSGNCSVAFSTPVLIKIYDALGDNNIFYSNGTSGQVNATPNENQTATLTAPAGTYFATVNFASYGTPTGTSPDFVINPGCHSATSQATSEGYLLGNSGSITIPATNAVFGDPCVGTGKRLYILASYAQSICNGSTVTITGNTSTGGVLSYRWESSTTSATAGFGPASGSNDGVNYTSGALTQTTWFRRIVTSCSETKTSSVVMVIVNPAFTAGAIDNTGQTICLGGNPSIIGSTTPASGGNGTIIYSWRSSADGYVAAIAGATAATYTPPAGLSVTTSYRRYVTGGTCNPGATVSTNTWTVTVTPTNTVGSASSTPTVCINAAMGSITHTTSGGTGISNSGVSGANGLPAGVSAIWSSNVITISGTPTVSGTFNYSIPLTGGCGTLNATGTITVTPVQTIALSSAAGTDSQTVCINTPITNITYTTTGATGATFAGLPTGVSGSWSGNVVTISGTPSTAGGTYTITLTGGCGTVTKTGTIAVTPVKTIALSSAAGTDSQTVCINSPITNITYTTTGATGATFAGLPAGVTGSLSGNVVTISGTPSTAGGTYTITLTGGCGTVTKTGTITVTPVQTIELSSAGGTDSQTVCINTPIKNITYTTTGATGATFAGLPTGVNGSWFGNVITISGTPSTAGGTYTITLTGGCGTVTKTGTITVSATSTAGVASSTPTLCINTVLTAITHTTTGATGISNSGISGANGLPAGVLATWSANVITISGTPTVSGTFDYSIPLTGGCGTVNATGRIIVTAANTVSAASASPTVCLNSPLPAITHTTTGATGINTTTGLPAGVTASFSGNKITISGTPTASGTFNYSIPLTGGCGNINATGTIKVGAVTTYNGTTWVGGTPDIYMTAIFNADYNTTSGNITACNCQIQSGKTLTIGAGSSATIQNNIINNGNIVVESDGNLIQNNDAGTYSGTATNFLVKREAKLKRLDYNYWASPVKGQQLKAFSPGTVATRFLSYDEKDDFFYAINSTYNFGAKIDGSFESEAKGYAIRANNNYPAMNVLQDFEGKFTGIPNNGVITFPLKMTRNGYNLVGNPYASNLDFDTLYNNNTTNINYVAYFWTNVNPNPAMQGQNYPGTGFTNNYAVLNGTGGVPATGTAAPGGSKKPNRYIKVGQGFIVKAKNSVDLQFKNEVRTDNTTSVFFNKNGVTPDRFWLQLTTPLEVTTTQLIGYLPQATNDFELDYDAPLMVLGSDAFYSLLDDRKLAIQGKASFVNTDVVSLGSSQYEAGNYTISLSEKEGIFAEGQNVYLKDKQTGILTNLSEGSYTFSATKGIIEGRFEIVYLPGSVLATGSNAKEELVIYRDGNDFIVKAQSKKITSVQVFDTAGRLIYVTNPNTTQAVVPSDRMVNGVYVLKINQNEQVTTKKVIK